MHYRYTPLPRPSTEELLTFLDHQQKSYPLPKAIFATATPCSRPSLQDPPTTQTEIASSNTPQWEAPSFLSICRIKPKSGGSFIQEQSASSKPWILISILKTSQNMDGIRLRWCFREKTGKPSRLCLARTQLPLKTSTPPPVPSTQYRPASRKIRTSGTLGMTFWALLDN